MARATYHHGDLRRTLIDATAVLIEERGPSGFSLREVARRAGVSPAAPSHHFGDAQGLLTAVAVEGFSKLVDAVEDLGDHDPHRRLVEHARRYVDVGISAPGHMAVMFRRDLVDTADPDYLAMATRAYDLVAETVAAAADGPDVDLTYATKTLWATCHGIVSLYPSGERSLDDDPEIDELVRRAASIVSRGLRVGPTPITENPS